MGSTSDVSSTNTTNTNTVPNHNHPYFLHTSDSPGMNLVNSCFDGNGYGGWRKFILIALSVKNKVGFIDGTHSEPVHGSPDLKLWSRCNDMVISWLLNSLSKEIASSVIYAKIARDLWKEFEDKFGQSNGYHLQKKLNDLVQG
ncbi:uncharacterized protein LOC142169747 [Nicotiana tabacum]|uniref:Uncharacterized protein LOC142169747 n=1 Tax=Nicotiana tabacum TaxID=4097 RepID=A0AC58SRZ1_TOBAC